eukprot:6608850-Prymnesium_polylepis.1
MRRLSSSTSVKSCARRGAALALMSVPVVRWPWTKVRRGCSCGRRGAISRRAALHGGCVSQSREAAGRG